MTRWRDLIRIRQMLHAIIEKRECHVAAVILPLLRYGAKMFVIAYYRLRLFVTSDTLAYCYRYIFIYVSIYAILSRHYVHCH